MTTGSQRAYDQIRENIITGRYPPSAHLKETWLAADLGLSRTPIREALRRLGHEGILNFSPQHGAFVPSWSEARIEQLYDLRAMLEANCAELAATRITPDDLACLRDLADRMEAAAAATDDHAKDAITQLNREFHERIMTCSGNERLRDMTLNAIQQLPVIHHSFRRYEPAQTQRSMRHHRDLIDALQVGDPQWASSMMRAHILAGKYQLRLASDRQLDATRRVVDAELAEAEFTETAESDRAAAQADEDRGLEDRGSRRTRHGART